MRVTTAAVSTLSRITPWAEPVMLSARVVGMPSAFIASEQRNSRIDERSTARPSPMREYGVRPAPLSCSSIGPARPFSSPSRMARPSPSWPAQTPNWWPEYTADKRLRPFGHAVAGKEVNEFLRCKLGGVEPDQRGGVIAGRNEVRRRQGRRHQPGVKRGRQRSKGIAQR